MKIILTDQENGIRGLYKDGKLIHSFSPSDDITFLFDALCGNIGAEFESVYLEGGLCDIPPERID